MPRTVFSVALTIGLLAVACGGGASSAVAPSSGSQAASPPANSTTVAPTATPTPTVVPPTPTIAPVTPRGATITRAGVKTEACKPSDDQLKVPGATTRWRVFAGFPVRAVPNDPGSEIGAWSEGAILVADCARVMPVTAAFPAEGEGRYWFHVTSSDGVSGWLAAGLDAAGPAPKN